MARRAIPGLPPGCLETGIKLSLVKIRMACRAARGCAGESNDIMLLRVTTGAGNGTVRARKWEMRRIMLGDVKCIGNKMRRRVAHNAVSLADAPVELATMRIRMALRALPRRSPGKQCREFRVKRRARDERLALPDLLVAPDAIRLCVRRAQRESRTGMESGRDRRIRAQEASALGLMACSASLLLQTMD